MKVRGYGASGGAQKTNARGRNSANKNSKQLKIMLIALGALVVGLVVVGIIIYGQLTNDNYTALFVDTAKPTQAVDIDPEVSGVQTQQPSPDVITYNGKSYKRNENMVNILFLGVDTTTEREVGNHSDMMIVCAVDTVAKNATLISIQRDTWSDISKIDTKTGKITEMTKNRMNTAYLFGGGPNKFGASNAKACIQNFFERKIDLDTPLDFSLNIPISFYASIDIDSIATIADAVGGVEVKLDTTIPDVGSKGKTVKLKGDKAQLYLRDRHNTPGGDIGRATHQRYFMLQLAKKIKDMGAVEAMTKLWDKLNAYGKTDLNLDQALAFAKILNNMDIDSIQQLAVPGDITSIKGASVIKHDEAKTLEMMLSVYYKEVQ